MSKWGPGQMADSVHFFDTLAHAVAATIPASPGGPNVVSLLGYHAYGDLGAGLYVRTTAGSPAGSFQSADGAYWQLKEQFPNVMQYGAFGDGIHDDHAAIQGALNANAGGTVNFPNPTPGAAFQGTISGTVLSASSVSGTIAVGQYVSGAGVTSATTISSFGNGAGGAGTYFLSASSTVPTAGETYAGGVYVCTSPLSIPVNTRVLGSGKMTCKIQANIPKSMGAFITLLDGAELRDLWIDGNASPVVGVALGAGHGNQILNEVRIVNFAAGGGLGSLHIPSPRLGTGSRMTCLGLEAWQTNGIAGSGLYGVVYQDEVSTGINSCTYFDFEGGGRCSFSFGGGGDISLQGGYVSDLAFSTNSKNIALIGMRIGTHTALALRGSGSMVGCDVYPQITIESGAAWNVGPNILNNPPVIDDSGNGSSNVFGWGGPVNYAPTMACGGTPITLGNGSLSGEWSRNGNVLDFTINFDMGTTTLLPPGGITFGLPTPSITLPIQRMVVGQLYPGGSNFYMIGGLISNTSGGSVVSLVGATTGAVTSTSPATITSTGVIQVSGRYMI